MSRFLPYNSILSLVFLLAGTPICAQTANRTGYAKTLSYTGIDNDSILSAFSERFVALDTVLNRAMEAEEWIALGSPSFSSVYDSTYNAKRMLERSAFKRKSGLELTGQVYQRIDNTLGFDEDNDQYSSYSAKLQGEIGWNFFNSSFLQRKSELRLIDLSNRNEWLQRQKQLAIPVWEHAKDAIEEKYDNLIAGVLNERLLNMEVLNLAYQFALEKDRTGNEKLLEVINERMRIEYAIARIGGMGNPASGTVKSGIRTVKPMIIEVDSALLLDYLRSHHTEMRISQVREDILGAKIRLTNYAHEMRLTPFVRASHYLRSAVPSSTNVEIGARFTFPLYDENSAKRKVMRIEQVLAGLDKRILAEDLMEKCRRMLAQLDRLNAAVITEYRHEIQLRRFIAIRKEAYLRSMNGYNHIARLEEYNEYLKSIERTYNLLRLRSLCLLELQKNADCTDLSRMVTIKNITE